MAAATTRWLVRFGYDGTGYYGWARQPGLRTVEAELERGVVRCGAAPSAVSARIQVASRTDRGVSALGNAVALTSSFSPGPLLRALNGIAPDIFFTATTEVPETFRARAATARVYRYLETPPSHDFRTWQAVADRFVGRIDVRSLGRGLPAGAPVWRTVESVTITPRAAGAVIELRAQSFVWGMVRKIVGALREVEAGRLSLSRLEQALRGELRLTLPMAEPEPLLLWDVEFGIPWNHFWGGPNRHQLAWERAVRNRLWAGQEMLDALSQATPKEGHPSTMTQRP